MSTKINIFKINEDGKLVVSTIELLSYDSFREIIKRDKTKDMAHRELAYIWFMADYESPVYKKGLSDKEAHTFILSKISFPDKWKPDAIVLKAIEDYKDTNVSVANEVIGELLKSFKYYGTIIRKVRTSISTLMDSDAGLTKTQAQELLDLISTLISVSKSIPGEVRVLKEAIKELEKDSGYKEETYLRGTEETVPDSADPMRDW
jgi:hypothetical protein